MGYHLDLQCGWGKCNNLLGRPLVDASEHGGVNVEDRIGVEILVELVDTLHDGLEKVSPMPLGAAVAAWCNHST